MVSTTTKISSRPVLLLFLVILVVAGVLVGFGVPLVSSEGMIIRARLVEGQLPAEPEDGGWAKVSPMTLPLSGQVITRPVWPEPTARALTVRSLHNGIDIAFLLEWQDNTKNDRLTPGTFRDGVAIGLPLGDAPAFFCMGQLDHYINSGIGRPIGKAISTAGPPRLPRRLAMGCGRSKLFRAGFLLSRTSSAGVLRP